MSGLKSAWEISLKKSNEMNPELKTKKNLDSKQKKMIAEIRKEYEARIADKEIIFDHKIKKLGDRVPPEQLETETEERKKQLAEEKQKLKDEMEAKIEAIRNS